MNLTSRPAPDPSCQPGAVPGIDDETTYDRLNPLVGALRFRGVELCEPCLRFGESLASDRLTPAQAVKHWVYRAGLRARALSGGELAVGVGVQGDA